MNNLAINHEPSNYEPTAIYIAMSYEQSGYQP